MTVMFLMNEKKTSLYTKDNLEQQTRKMKQMSCVLKEGSP